MEEKNKKIKIRSVEQKNSCAFKCDRWAQPLLVRRIFGTRIAVLPLEKKQRAQEVFVAHSEKSAGGRCGAKDFPIECKQQKLRQLILKRNLQFSFSKYFQSMFLYSVFSFLILFLSLSLLFVPISFAYSKNISNSFAKDDFPSLYLIALRYDPYPVEPGSYFDLWLKLENKGSVDAKDITVSFDKRYPFSLDDSGQLQNEDMFFGKVIAHGSVLVHYKIKVASDAVRGTNDLHFSYKSSDGVTHGELQTPIFVQTQNAILSLKSVTTEPEKVSQGETAKIHLVLKNNANEYLRYITTTLVLYSQATTTTGITTLELPFTPLGEGNEKSIALLSPGEEKSMDFTIVASPTAEAKPYKIPVVISYYDSLGKNYTKIILAGLVVGSEPVVQVSVDESKVYTDTTNGDITIKFVNRGVTDVKFLSAKLLQKTDSTSSSISSSASSSVLSSSSTPAYTILSSDEVYVGKIDSDDYQTANFKLFIPKKKDSIVLPLLIKYADANNVQYEKNISLVLPIYSEKEAGKETSSSGTYIFFAIIVVVVLFIFYRRWEKKKKRE